MPITTGGLIAASAVGAGISSALGIGSGAMNYRNQKKLAEQQFKYQQQLNAEQQQYARENADIQYQRQRDLTSDSWLLNKQGMRAAGLNPAFMDGTSNPSASVDAAASPNAGSVGLPSAPQIDLADSANQGVQTLLAVKQNAAQVDLINEQAENMRQRNITQLQKDLADLANKIADTKGKDIQNKYIELYNEAESRYYEQNAKNKAYKLDNDTFMSDMDAMLYPQMKILDLQEKAASIEKILAEGQLTRKDVQYYKYKLNLIKSQIRKNDAEANDAQSHVGVNKSQVELNDSQKELNEANKDKVIEEKKHQITENDIQNLTKYDVVKAAKLAVKERGPQSISDFSWSVFNEWETAPTWKKALAIGGIPLGFIERSLGGASEEYGKTLVNGKPEKPKITIVKHIKAK